VGTGELPTGPVLVIVLTGYIAFTMALDVACLTAPYGCYGGVIHRRVEPAAA
jgi:hypothetical protein